MQAKLTTRRHRYYLAITLLIQVLVFSGWSLAGWSQTLDVSARVTMTHQRGHAGTSPSSFANAVIWLVSTDANPPLAKPQKARVYTLVQKDKKFIPHLLVVPTGSSVDFPNLDPFFHNVFSLFNGKRFDLGLYEAHTHRAVRFDREGISYIFCNIHPDMGAVIITLGTPYYGISGPDGAITIHNVPQGSYRIHVWAEDVANDDLNALNRVVQISPRSAQLGTLHLVARGDLMRHHSNKFGDDYPPATTDTY